MKTSLLLALVAGGAAGAGSAALTSGLLSSAPETTLAAVDPLDDSGALGDEIAALRRANETLSDRLRSLEDRVSMAAPDRAPAGPAEAESLDIDELRELLASFESMGQAPPAKFQTMVEQALASKEERDRLEREERRRIEREERMDERIAEMGEKLGLDPGQRTAMRDILVERDATREEMFSAMRDGGGFGGGDRGNMRETFTAMTEATNTKIQAVLTEQQYTQYQESYADRGFGRGGGGDRGGRGGRGGD